MSNFPKPDLIKLRGLWYLISGATLVIGLIAWTAKGVNYGVDFTGGTTFDCKLPRVISASEESRIVAQLSKELGARVQASNDRVFIRTAALTETERSNQQGAVERALARTFKVSSDELRDDISAQLVGPAIGRELTRKAVMGTIVGLLGIMVWIWIRYNIAGDGFRFAMAGILALFHDVLLMIGVFVIAGIFDDRIEADSSMVAALLTVVGYSINDSVVIFDRIRENMKLRRRDRFEMIVNDSLWQTMTRSVNTGLATIFTLVILFLFGGESVRSFSLALLVGVSAGAYSSIFVASPLLVSWRFWSERRHRPAGSPASSRQVAAPAAPASRPLPATSPLRTSTTTPLPSAAAATNGLNVGVATEETAEEKKAAERRRRIARRGQRKRRF